MYEYYLEHRHNGSNHVIFGYNWEDAVRRSGIDPQVWTCLFADYIDWYKKTASDEPRKWLFHTLIFRMYPISNKIYPNQPREDK